MDNFDPVAIGKMMMQGYVANPLTLEDMFFVKGKVAIVTGGSSGLGFCVAQRFLQGGASVVIAGSTKKKGEEAVELLNQAGYTNVSFIKTDVSNEDDVKNMVKFAADTYGSIDILVTAGGIWAFGRIFDYPEADFQRVLNVNLVGTFLCAKHVGTYMVEHGIKGKMVLVSSNVALRPFPIFGGYPAYVASKGGVISMTREIAKELFRYGIQVNTVAPGAMGTPGGLSNGCVSGLSPEKQAEIMGEVMMMSSDANPPAPVDTVAIICYAFCTKMSDGITGEVINADNGMWLDAKYFQPETKRYPAAE